MAILTVVNSNGYGAAWTWESADPNGDRFINNGKTFILVDNIGSGDGTVRLTSRGYKQGLLIEPPSVSLSAGQMKAIMPLATYLYNDANGYADLAYTYSGGIGAFPETAILDDFNRVDEGPPPSTNWGTFPAPLSIYWGLADGLNVSGNECAAAANDYAGNYWNGSFSADVEVYATLTVLPDDGFGVALGARFSPALDNDGYIVAFVRDDLGGDFAELHGASMVSLGTQPITLSAGDRLGLRVIGTALTVWQDTGGGWVEIMNVTDANIERTGNIALFQDGNTSRLDNFGGGSLGSAVDLNVAVISL